MEIMLSRLIYCQSIEDMKRFVVAGGPLHKQIHLIVQFCVALFSAPVLVASEVHVIIIDVASWCNFATVILTVSLKERDEEYPQTFYHKFWGRQNHLIGSCFISKVLPLGQFPCIFLSLKNEVEKNVEEEEEKVESLYEFAVNYISMSLFLYLYVHC